MIIPNFSIGLHRSSNKIKEEFGKLISSPDITSQSAKFLEQNAGSIFGSQPKELINKLVDGIALFEKTSNIHNHLGAYKNGRYTTINNGGKNTYVLTPTLDQLENFLNEMNSEEERKRKELLDKKKIRKETEKEKIDKVSTPFGLTGGLSGALYLLDKHEKEMNQKKIKGTPLERLNRFKKEHLF